MQIVTDSFVAPPHPEGLPEGARLIGKIAHLNRLGWQVYDSKDFRFGFRITDGGDLLHVSKDEFETGFKAEKAAQAWCSAYAPETAPEYTTVPADDFDQTVYPVDTRPLVAGWRIQTTTGARGTVDVELHDEETGVIAGGDGDFAGFDGADAAIAFAEAWATENPAHSTAASLAAMAEDLANGTDDDAPSEDAPAVDPLSLGDSLEVDKLRAERDMLREQLEAARRGMAADVSELADKARRHRELRDQHSDLTYKAAQIKDRLKGVTQELADLGVEGFQLIEDIGNGSRSKSWQLGLTFDASSAVRASVGAQAAGAVAAIGAQKWSFNAVDHKIESSSELTPDGMRFTTWIAGHRETTEGFGEEYQQAAEQTKNAASVVFADCDPGQTAPPEGVRLPAKRGRKPKLNGHDLAAVKGALESSMSTGDAAAVLKVKLGELESYIEKVGLVTSQHLAKHAGEELKSAPLEKAGKPRGRKKGGGK